jgi:hypothetical protein
MRPLWAELREGSDAFIGILALKGYEPPQSCRSLLINRLTDQGASTVYGTGISLFEISAQSEHGKALQ